eukprot:scaffold3362_cov402-Prasinococcus_capsulatus_cf.AAC.16
MAALCQVGVLRALQGVRLVGLAAGYAHSMFLSEAGDVYVCGWNEDGQLGTGCTRALTEPELLESPLMDDISIRRCCSATSYSKIMLRAQMPKHTCCL